ncbi:hypothetical protein [Nonomuraea jiangxiensis]|uniref:hypothetical protein n=1 Tax=Nonomuraea jiangxiensis TaxID=633440 RepID=UPI000B88A92F|nr:hypothetical protein [Nonomuraea jiangxiensis]
MPKTGATWLAGWREHGSPGPFRPAFWRSPLRGPWLTSVLGLVLPAGLIIVAVTGLLPMVAGHPGALRRLGSALPGTARRLTQGEAAPATAITG